MVMPEEGNDLDRLEKELKSKIEHMLKERAGEGFVIGFQQMFNGKYTSIAVGKANDTSVKSFIYYERSTWNKQPRLSWWRKVDMRARGMKYTNISGELFGFIKKKLDNFNISTKESDSKTLLSMLADYFEDGENVFRHLFPEQDQRLPARLQEYKEKTSREEYLKQIKTLEKLLCGAASKKRVNSKEELEEFKDTLVYAKNCGVESSRAIEIYKEKAKEFIKTQKKEMRKLKELADYF